MNSAASLCLLETDGKDTSKAKTGGAVGSALSPGGSSVTKNTEDFVLDVVRGDVVRGHRVAASPHLSQKSVRGVGMGRRCPREPHPAPAWEGRAPGEN